ncbi:MAG: serine/threonine-protein kinase [Acidobacteriota bacterium]
MDAQRWNAVKPLLDRALDLPRDARAAFLDRHCAGDISLRTDVESYLAFDDETDALFDAPLVDLIAGRAPEYRVGETVGDFKLEGEIARGGMGVVYRARRHEASFEQIVALKVLKRGFDTGDFVRRFRDERRILAKLRHPHIAHLIDGGTTHDGLPFLAMEFVDGFRLDRYACEAELTLDQRLTLFDTICDAVHTAHQHMIVHCDLKPSNVLITASGAPKLLDFGIAKMLTQDADAVTRSSTTLRLGTPPYASPEQIDGQTITVAADVYSLGCVLFQLLTEQPPARVDPGATDPPLQVPSRHLPRRASDRRDTGWLRRLARPPKRAIDRDLDAIVLMAMARDPAQRYATVTALREDLARYRSSQPVRAARTTWQRRLRLGLLRYRRQLLVAALIVMTFVAVTAGVVGTLNAIGERVQTVRAEANRDLVLELLEVLDETRDESDREAARSAVDKLLNSQRYVQSSAMDQAKLYDRFARILLRRGQRDQAIRLLENGMTLLSDAGPASEQQLTAMTNNLALATADRQFARAAELFEDVLARYAAHPEWRNSNAERLDVLHNYVGTLRNLRRFDDAEQAYLELLTARGEEFGDDSPEFDRTQLALGMLYWRQQRFAEAEPLIDQVVARRADLFGPDHPSMATALRARASLRLEQGRLDEAIDHSRQALAIREDKLGSTEPRTDRARNGLAHALLLRGNDEDLAEAEALLETVVARSHRLSTQARISARRNLAAVYLDLNRPAEAEALLHPLLEAEQQTPLPPVEAWRYDDMRSLLGEARLRQPPPPDEADLEEDPEEAKEPEKKDPADDRQKAFDLLTRAAQGLNQALGPNARQTREAEARLQQLQALLPDVDDAADL